MTLSITFFKVLDIDLQNHQPILENLNSKAERVIQTSNPATAHNTRIAIDDINKRYEKLQSTVSSYSTDLNGMSTDLSSLVEDVDRMEDWLFSVLDVLESKDLKKQVIPDIEKTISVS